MQHRSTPATPGQRSMERRMTRTESDALMQLITRNPRSSFYPLVSEFSGRSRNISRADALYILGARGYAVGVTA